jgi:hypothetical protein
VIASRTGEHIRPSAGPTSASASLLLSSLSSCLLTLPPTLHFSSCAIKAVFSSLLILGHAVDGPVHLTDIKDSVLVFGCRQFRMHDAHNVDVYLHCKSRPIIEDCSEIRFHLYGEKEGNQWAQVDDFKWLRAERSPNWSAVEAEGKEERWRELAEKEVGEVDVKKVLNEVLGRSVEG